MKMRPFGRLIRPEAALHRLLAATVPVDRLERVPLVSALGRVAARTHRAPFPVPAFSRATWDGYALAARETRGASPRRPVPLKVVGEVFAEGGFSGRVGRGECVAIATGAPLPPGTDAILIFEEADLRGGRVSVRHSIASGERIARPGADFPRGTVLAEAGTPLGPATLGALASVGRSEALVFRRPRVAIVPNGNELALPGARLRRGQIFESNNVVLAALVQAAGAEVQMRPPVEDDPRTIERELRSALATHDLVISTGGSSVGEHDHLPTVFPRLGRLLFHGISVRPGKPTLAAVSGRRLLLGMPGHPSSCLTNAFWLVLPVLRKLARLPGPGSVELPVRLTAGVAGRGDAFTQVVPLYVEGSRATPTFKDSSAITSLTAANAYTVLPPGTEAVPRGTCVRARRLLPPVGPVPPEAYDETLSSGLR
jgi:molybdenum cofactor synthesis domain-containing protein